MMPSPLRSASLAGLLAFGLITTSCSIFRPRSKSAPVVETVRTADSPTPPTAARDLADVMATDLQLTPDQTARVRTILTSTVEQANVAKNKFPAQSPQLLAEQKRINITSQKELQQVLGPTKFKQLQANRRKMATQMQQRQK